MKVLIVNNMAPFVWGGAEELAAFLQKNLIIAGHEAEVLRIPFQWEPATGIPYQMLMARAFELWNVERVIALKFPAYLIRHPQKTIWLVHQYRQAYDLLDAGQSNLPQGEIGVELKKIIRNADNESFAEARSIYTISSVTKQRLQKYNAFNADVLIPPVNDPELFPGGKSGDYIFAAGRVNSMKRQHLLVEAMEHVDSRARLLIAGPPDTQADADRIWSAVEKLGLKDRVQLDLRFLPREIYAEYLNRSAAVAYLPFDEDALSYVATEAATAGKPMITLSDSGGILGVVKQNQTGWIAEPNIESLAEAINSVFSNSYRTEQYGQAAKKFWEEMGINWPNTIEALLR